VIVTHAQEDRIMLRRIHSLPGLIVALLLAVLAISGAILSIDPAIERLGTRVPGNGRISVATLADRVARHYPGVEQIQRSPSGTIIVYYSRPVGPWRVFRS
jgi:sulfite reductase (NADPH) flavoprotein alpha-component